MTTATLSSMHTQAADFRARVNRRPMTVFALAVAAAFGTMFVVPVGLGAVDTVAKSQAAAPMRVTQAPPSASDIACRGQAWGAESDACLAAIAREANGSERSVRRLANASPLWTTSAIY
jgi:hypothetical protein